MKMKKLLILCAIAALFSGNLLAQSWSQLNKGSWNRVRHYGAASFAADSTGVFDGTGKWVTLTASYDSTAGTTWAYICINNDSTNAFPLAPGTNGNYGTAYTKHVYGLKWIRVKGAVPVSLSVE
jgi:hypothetical protein